MKKLILITVAFIAFGLSYGQNKPDGDLINMHQSFSGNITISSSNGKSYTVNLNKKEKEIDYSFCTLLKIAKEYKDKGYRIIPSNFHNPGSSGLNIFLEKKEEE